MLPLILAAQFGLQNLGIHPAGMLCIGMMGLLLHFLPTFVAAMRGHQNAVAIFVLNLLLGWTVIGWVVALVWAFTAVERAG